jgi:hypothetical protein
MIRCPRMFPILFFVLVSATCGVTLWSQEPRKEASSPCFRLRVHLNGKPIDGPRVVTLKAEHTEATLSLQDGCFVLPPALLKEKTLDLVFTLPYNRIHLSDISAGFFAYSWDIELADKRFDSDVVLPKHARTKEACVVVFHAGEPETQMTQTSCRTPLRKGRKTDWVKASAPFLTSLGR